MVKTRFYYLIEELDIDGDKQSDGFLISQYKLDRYKNKIFTKNKYVTFKDFKSYIQKFNENKTGGFFNNYKNNNNNQIVTMTMEEYNNLRNNPNQINNNNQYPPRIVIVDNNSHQGHQGHQGYHGQQSNSFLGNFTSGLGLGAGWSLGDSAMDAFF